MNDEFLPFDSPDAVVGFSDEIDDLVDAEIPDSLPVLPLRGVVVFPAAVVPLLVSRPASVRAVEEVMKGDRILALVAQKNGTQEEPSTNGLHQRGTVGRVLKTLQYPDGSVRILVQGIGRMELVDFPQVQPYLKARIRVLSEAVASAFDLDAMRSRLVNEFARFVDLTPHLPEELSVMAVNTADAARAGDLIAAHLSIAVEDKQEILASLDIRDRLTRLLAVIGREIQLLELGQKIQSDVQDELSKSQREFYLRQQMRAIQKELGDADPRNADIDALQQRVDEAEPPAAARKAAQRELERLRVIPIESAEHSVVRNYVEWIADLPWSKSTADNLDIPHARRVLDEDHYDLEKIKERILEFLAVRQLRRSPKGPILCFVGPPGTGKTSLGKSIARAMGREFIRVSLGGMRDESEIRGHRRTYIGSLPGRIIQGLKNAGSNNPVFMFDEIDKIGADFRGDPASALLEVLDPEQNDSFTDHFLDIPFDLSRVMFITTANLLEPIAPPLRDRMEVIELAGYTDVEKLEIARRHLIPKQIEENGISADQIVFTREGLLYLIHRYTKEAGLRNLEREIGSLCRKVARAVTEGATEVVVAGAEKIRSLLGAERFFPEVAERVDEPGVATGLVWTPMGGDIVFIEATKMQGTKGVLITGNLGDVMKESAQAALSHIRSRAARLGIVPGSFDDVDIHVHVPAGAVPKDGPSAGVTIATALTSLFAGRPVRHDLAMTGELTLRGKVLPVGGVKEKILGAKRAGISAVILPARNEKDLDEVPAHVRQSMTFHFVETVDEILELALEPAGQRAATAQVGSLPGR
jgi:ATP-dependent Lon protease